MRRVLIAALAVMALEIGVAFVLGFHGPPGIHNLFYLSASPIAVAFVVFPGWRGKLLGAAGLWPLLLPAAIGAELLAHAAGSCLQ